MKRFVTCMVVVAVFSLALFNDSVNAQKEKEKKGHTIKEIMKLAHTDKMALLKTISADVKEGKWDAANKHSKTLIELAGELSAAMPKKGDADSWKKVTSEYKETAVKLSEATEGKKAEEATNSLKTLQGSCKGCHSVHK